jgi:hypothetical protein
MLFFRGDTIAAAVDAALDVCSPLFLQADPNFRKAYRDGEFGNSHEFPQPHFDESNLKVSGKGSKLFGMKDLLQGYFQHTGVSMEETCVYGMEGNPYFTKHLKLLEAVVYGMKPRPLQHLYIHTDSVVTSEDGPTTLYIDQFSVKDNVSKKSLL